MANKILYATKDATLWDDGAGRGNGKDPHNVVGNVSGEFRTLIDFESIPSGITDLTYARLYMFRSTNTSSTHGFTPDNGAQIIPSRITADWVEGTKGTDHLYSLSNSVVYPGPAVTGALSARGSQPSSGWWYITVTDIVQSWVDGSSQKGIRLAPATGADIIFDSVQGSDSTKKPYLELQYGTGGTTTDPNNHKPDAPLPTLLPGADGRSLSVEMQYRDPDVGDTSTKYRIQIVSD